MDAPQSVIAPSQTSGRSEKVRDVFENVPSYVNGRQLDIRMRVATVTEWAASVEWQRLLDIGCGSGAISLPLLSPASHLTLLDLSASMLATVRASVPQSMAANVETRNEDFMAATFDPQSFDLIVCVGVLAHVDSPAEFISKIAKVLRPGGTLILAFTDSKHFVGRLARLTGWLKELIAPARYPTNVISFSDVAQSLRRNHLNLVSKFRYAEMVVPGIEKIVPAGAILKLSRLVFGRCTQNRNAWLGNEYICLLTRDRTAS
jgi:ubiquinone/menaquinone biosynthesis C-methylase UbiE